MESLGVARWRVAFDAAEPATLSERVVAEVIRDQIGFGGVLASDDLSMGALGGRLGNRTSRALAAGCDRRADLLREEDDRFEELVLRGVFESDSANHTSAGAGVGDERSDVLLLKFVALADRAAGFELERSEVAAENGD